MRDQTMWLAAAFLSAVFGAMATLVIRQFVKETDSTLATALRTCVVLAAGWLMTWRAGSLQTIREISMQCMIFIVLSGISTALSWLCYYRALTGGEADKVMAIEKASIILTLFLAVTIFGERSHLGVKLVCMCIMAYGLWMLALQNRKTDGMPAGRENPGSNNRDPWLWYAFLAAIFSSLNTVFSKIGVAGMDFSLATAVNTSVVMPVVWGVVLWEMRAHPHLGHGHSARWNEPKIKSLSVSRREAFWIVMSGLATGACWLCYFYAVKYGPVSVVLPVNKLSVPIAVIYSYFFMGERLKRGEQAGMVCIVGGMLAVAVFS